MEQYFIDALISYRIVSSKEKREEM